MKSLRTYAGLAVALWTAVVALSLSWGIRQQRRDILESARNEARTITGMDNNIRDWAIRHGGVYVPVTKETPPDPALRVPERDVRTPSGRRLTLVGHDSVMREIARERLKLGLPTSQVKGLESRVPRHSPDAWERQALKDLADGRDEALTLDGAGRGERLRLMRAFRAEAACFKCHAPDGAEAVEGGISVEVSLAPLLENRSKVREALNIGHLVMWLLGLLGIWFGYRRLSLAQAQLQEGESRLRAIFDTIPDGILAADAETKRFVLCNPGIRRLFGYTEEEFKSLGVADIHPKAFLPQVVAEFEAQARGEKHLALDLPCLRKDGTVFQADITSATAVFAGNKVLLGVFRDNVERKRNEALTTVLGHLLQLSLKDIPLAEFLDLSLEEILGIPGIALQQKGAILLIEGDPGILVMRAQRNLGREVQAACARVPLGHCICGRAAQSAEVQFSSCLDERHEVSYPGISQHGHYCVPLKSGGLVLGVLNLYLGEGHRRDEAEVGFLTACADVLAGMVERKRAQEALGESEARFRGLFKSSGDALMTLAPPSWSFTSGNPAAIAMFRAKDEADFTSRGPWELFPERQPDGSLSADKAREMIEKAMRDGSNAFEWTHKRLDGEDFAADVLLTRLESRDATFLQATVRDISERKKAETALRESEARIRAVTDSAHDAILMMDPAGRISYWNPMAEKVFGYAKEEALGKNLHEFLAPARYHKAHYAAIADFRRTGKGAAVGKTVELEAIRKGGEEITIALSLSAVQLQGGWYAIGIVRDITGDKRRQKLAVLGHEALEILNRPAAAADTIRAVLESIQKSTGLEAVGIRLRSGEDFPYFAQHGFSQDFLLSENTLVERGADGGMCRGQDGKVSLGCTCGLVISGKTDPASPLFTPGGSFWTNDSMPLLDLTAEQDPRLHPRNRCIHEGFMSMALVPVRAGEDIVGLLQLNGRKKGCFTLESVQFFEGLCGSIGLALMRKQAEEQREAVIIDLKKALAEVKTLGGFIPICGHCKKIRDDKGFWESVEKYVTQRSEAKFSHGVCPDCAKKFYGEYYEDPPAADEKKP